MRRAKTPRPAPKGKRIALPRVPILRRKKQVDPPAPVDPLPAESEQIELFPPEGGDTDGIAQGNRAAGAAVFGVFRSVRHGEQPQPPVEPPCTFYNSGGQSAFTPTDQTSACVTMQGADIAQGNG